MSPRRRRQQPSPAWWGHDKKAERCGGQKPQTVRTSPARFGETLMNLSLPRSSVTADHFVQEGDDEVNPPPASYRSRASVAHRIPGECRRKQHQAQNLDVCSGLFGGPVPSSTAKYVFRGALHHCTRRLPRLWVSFSLPTQPRIKTCSSSRQGPGSDDVSLRATTTRKRKTMGIHQCKRGLPSES